MLGGHRKTSAPSSDVGRTLLAGALVPMIGALAAVGLLLLLGGAVIAHLRSGGGPRELLPAIVLGLTTLAFLLLVLGGLR